MDLTDLLAALPALPAVWAARWRLRIRAARIATAVRDAVDRQMEKRLELAVPLHREQETEAAIQRATRLLNRQKTRPPKNLAALVTAEMARRRA